MALIFIDLDKFKMVNDTYGHAAGDEMLKQVAKRLKLAVREDDMIARLGGDEFTVLLTKISSPDDALKVANKLIKNIANPFTFEGNQFYPGCSAGISLYPQHATESDQLLAFADCAMYDAKVSGQNMAKTYIPES